MRMNFASQFNIVLQKPTNHLCNLRIITLRELNATL